MPSGETGRQPWLHDLVTVLRAPTVALCEQSGQMRPDGAQGVLHADVRVLSEAVLTVGGQEPAPIAVSSPGAGVARFFAVARDLGDAGADPTVRVDRTRTVAAGSVTEVVEISSTAARPVSSEVELRVAADLARIERIKAGPAGARPVTPHPATAGVTWAGPGVRVELTAPGAVPATDGDEIVLRWPLEVPPGGRATVSWSLAATVRGAVVVGLGDGAGAAPLGRPVVTADDPRIPALAQRSFDDLEALLMTPAGAPDQLFTAAGAPWFCTLFGRDSLWAARFLLPFGTGLALGTLRALAARQGTRHDPERAEAPGKILHELRSEPAVHEGSGGRMTLPPVYYGTVDATALWICLLHDAWRWGAPRAAVEALLPALEAALGWLRDDADPDGDGFVEYLDATGRGLANQGWKDSGDAIRFADGRIATGPVALCEVQGYAHEAAVGGATLLDHFGRPGGDAWRAWAAALARRFRERFWVRDGATRFPALALDGEKRPVDSLTSNIGHLLGTGLLSEAEADEVTGLLLSPEMASGFGLRTMSARAGGYSPLSYHCGSVWTHDTAVAVHGLARSGRAGAAAPLVEGLLAAASGFDYRLPELFSGDPRAGTGRPVPYPASCRPQAWASAAIGPVLQAVTGLSVQTSPGRLSVTPPPGRPFGAVRVGGVRHDGQTLEVDAGP